MLPLLLTVLATAYVVVPELLTRFIIGLRLMRKVTAASRSEEVLRAAFWAALPLAIAWSIRGVGPWKTPPGIANSAQVVFSGLYSEKTFEANTPEFYRAFSTFFWFNLLLLLRVYLIALAGSALFASIAVRLGSVRGRLKGRHPFLTGLLHSFFVPRISEWDVALSPMLLRDRKQLIVRIDVLTKSGVLYRGTVYEKRINGAGDLATLILQNAQRMMRDEFTRDRTLYEQQRATNPQIKKPQTESYWRAIPGELFLLNGSEISSVNVRHVRPVGILEPREDDQLLKAFQSLREQIARDVRERERIGAPE